MTDQYLTLVAHQVEFEDAASRYKETSWIKQNSVWGIYPFSPTQNAAVTTTNPLNGTCSFLCDGTWQRSISHQSPINLSSYGDWTVDIAVKITGSGTATTWHGMIGHTNDWRNGSLGNHCWQFNIKADRSALQFQWASTSSMFGSPNAITCPFSFSLNTKYYLRLVWSSGTLYWFVDGNLIQTSTGLQAMFFVGSNSPAMVLGGDRHGGGGLTGLLDALRISVGVARSTTTYTPETGQFDVFVLAPLAHTLPASAMVLGNPFSANILIPQVTYSTTLFLDGVAALGTHEVWMPKYKTKTDYEQSLTAAPSTKTAIISGVTSIEGTVASRMVRLYIKSTGMLVAQKFSNPDGSYAFYELDPAYEYFAVAHDHQRSFNAVIQDMIQP